MKNDWGKNFEKKFSKYAIPNLSLYLIIGYAIGYVMQIVNVEFLGYLTLDPVMILQGQVWRLVTWLLIPPASQNLFFTLITLYFYYSIGSTLEQVWGTYRYNCYLFSGMIFTILGSFVLYAIANVQFAEVIESLGESGAKDVFTTYGSVLIDGEKTRLPAIGFYQFSTYYINMSILLAFAATYPDIQFLFMFLIPIKAKVIGIIDVVLLAYSFLIGDLSTKIVIVASLLNFILFFFSTRNYSRISPSEYKRKADFHKKMRQAKQAGNATTYQGRNVITRHKCAICGRTELDDETLEFRFCSKCEGNYEYCMDHLYTHEHVKRIVPSGTDVK